MLDLKSIPLNVQKIAALLEAKGYESFVVGGCVRDIILGREPKDWDIATRALPDQIMNLLPDGRYENIFGTVIVPFKDEEGKVIEEIEITTFRSEQGYSDRRHPDQVVFEDKLENDLSRRDFTINALALKFTGQEIKREDFIDLFGGEKDLRKKIIRSVGEPSDRFKEDALRMLRAVRFACELGFEIELKTQRAIIKLAGGIKFISNERIRDEVIKILASPDPYRGIMLLFELKLLQYILPELLDGINVEQGGHHTYSVFKHSVLSLKYCPSNDWQVRLATLLHDVAKPRVRRIIENKITFYNHELVGARLTEKILRRLKFSLKEIERISLLVKSHMFYYNVGEVTASSVRRLIQKVGKENLKDLIDLRIGDRLGSGTKKAKPYKLRHLEYMLERVQNDPVSVKMLKVNGDILMDKLKIEAGPRLGAMLEVLLSLVIDNPENNNFEYLLNEAEKLKNADIDFLRAQAKEKIQERRKEDDEKMKEGYWVN